MSDPDDITVRIGLHRHPAIVVLRLIAIAVVAWGVLIGVAALACHACSPVRATRDTAPIGRRL